MSRTDTCCWWKGKTETLSCFCLEYSARECRILFLVWVGLMWFLFRLSVPETQLCEQWSGEAWTQPPMAISVERRQPNKQRKAWCVQVTAQPAVKKHLTLETIKAITCSGKPNLLITGHCLSDWLGYRDCAWNDIVITHFSKLRVTDADRNIFWFILKIKFKGGHNTVQLLQLSYYSVILI